MTTFETADGVTLAVDAEEGAGPIMLFQQAQARAQEQDK